MEKEVPTSDEKSFREELLAEIARTPQNSPRRELLQSLLDKSLEQKSRNDPRHDWIWDIWDSPYAAKKQVARDKLLSSIVLFTAIISSVLSVISSLFSVDLTENLPSVDLSNLIQSNGAYLVTVVGLFAAVSLFSIRGYFPRTYGFLEIWVGVATLINAAMAVSIGSIPSLLQYLAGVYVITRGLDNYAKALTPESKVGAVFKRLFNNPR